MARRSTARTATEQPAIDIVSRIQRAEPELSPAERRVAAAVQLDFEAATRLTIAELAARAGVSQPTVTRFCRSVGCASFNDFKISLASTMTVAAVYLRSDRVFSDDVGQLAQSVMLRAANAVQACLGQLDTASVGRAIDAITAGRRLDIYGQGGGSAVMAEDAKLLRMFRAEPLENRGATVAAPVVDSDHPPAPMAGKLDQPSQVLGQALGFVIDRDNDLDCRPGDRHVPDSLTQETHWLSGVRYRHFLELSPLRSLNGERAPEPDR